MILYKSLDKYIDYNGIRNNCASFVLFVSFVVKLIMF